MYYLKIFPLPIPLYSFCYTFSTRIVNQSKYETV